MRIPSRFLTPLLGASVIVLFFLSSCGHKVMKVADKQMDELIEKELPIGATKSQVMAFVDSLKLEGLKILDYGHQAGDTEGLKEGEAKIGDHLTVNIPKVGQDPSQFQVYNMTIVFYFGKDDRLISHKIETRGDW